MRIFPSFFLPYHNPYTLSRKKLAKPGTIV